MITYSRSNDLLTTWLNFHLAFLHSLSCSFNKHVWEPTTHRWQVKGLWRDTARTWQPQFLSLNVPWLADICVSGFTTVALKCHLFLLHKCPEFSHHNPPSSKCHRTNVTIENYKMKDLCAKAGSWPCNSKPNNRGHYLSL